MTLLDFMNLFDEFRAASWDGWRGILARLTPTVREFYGIVGRGAGKSRIVALLACFFASRSYARAPGEFIYIGVFGPDRKQAGLTFKYILGLLRSVPPLSALIVSASKDCIELSNHVVVEVITASIAAPRGRAYALVIVEEAAFLPTDASANPDLELLRAVRPALARVPGSLLAVVSSPYARRGIIWAAWQKYHDKPDGDVLLVQHDTLSLNPTFDQRAIDKAYQDDPSSAQAEYAALFRTDVESYLDPAALHACVVPGRHELPPMVGVRGSWWADPSGGGTGNTADSFTIARGRRVMVGGQPVAVIDCVRETRPPFDPEAVVSDYAALIKSYGDSTVTGDRYAGSWPAEAFKRHGITYVPALQTKSELYKDALALLNSGRIELLDHSRLLAQLGGLERRVGRGGRDSVDHPPDGHDDLANVVCGVAVSVAVSQARHRSATWDEPHSESSTDVTAGTGLYFANGMWTHALGDTYAEKVLSGEIALIQARMAERIAQKHRRAFLRADVG